MRIQSNLGSDIAMAFDECVENPARYEYAKASVERTTRWLERCIDVYKRQIRLRFISMGERACCQAYRR